MTLHRTLSALLAGLAALLACSALGLSAAGLAARAGAALAAPAQVSAFGGAVADPDVATPKPIQTVADSRSSLALHGVPCAGGAAGARPRTCFEGGAR